MLLENLQKAYLTYVHLI